MGMLTEDISSSKRRHQRQEENTKSFSLGLLLKSTALEFCSVFSFAEKDLAAVEDEPNKSQQGALAAKVVNHILGCINKTVASRTREKINSLSLALVRLCLEYCVQFWTRVDQLELIQLRATKPVWELESMIYDEKLRKLGLFSLEKKRLGGASNCCLRLSRGMILGCPICSSLDVRAVYICRSSTPVFNHTAVTHRNRDT